MPLRPLLLPLLLLSLLAAASASVPPALSRVRRLQSELSSSDLALRCRLSRARHIASLERSVAAAVACRRVCLRLPSRRLASRCLRRRPCAAKPPLQRRLAAARALACPRTGRPRDATRRLLRRAAADARRALGLPRPVYPALVVEPAGAAQAAVVVLHGVGGRAEDTREFVRAVRDAGGLRDVRFVVPQAPTRPVTFLNVTVPSWFNLLSNTVDGPQAGGEIVRAAGNVDAIMEIQRRVYGVAPDRVLVMGISQGAALAATVYMRHRVGAAVMLSGFLPIAGTYPDALGAGSAKAPLLMFHGDRDETVRFEIGQLSARIMRRLGRSVRFRRLRGEGHQYTDATNARVAKETAQFIAKRLAI